MQYYEADILILGAGLAGMRAAWAALQENPEARVLIISAKNGPCGSSFANVNDSLGMQVCFTDRDKELFCQEVKKLAWPGWVDDKLVGILAEESSIRFRELEALGLKFIRNCDGRLQLFSACFSPASKRAVVFKELSHAFSLFKKRILDLGGYFFSGCRVRNLVLNEDKDKVVGAALESDDRDIILIQAKVVITALGGPAPLFKFNLAGPGNPGSSFGILHRAGAFLANQSFIQFMWADVDKRQFFPVHLLPQKQTNFGSGQESWPDFLDPLFVRRGEHCPVAYARPDTVIDKFLINKMKNHILELHNQDDGWIKVTLMAHAGNGGAKIDEYGRTNIEGLYACGECATGMHGANRLGGAMVAATQVFGFRAGQDAAKKAKKSLFLSREKFIDLINEEDVLLCDYDFREQVMDEIALSLQKQAFEDRYELVEKIKNRVEELLSLYFDPVIKAVLLTVSQICQHRLDIWDNVC